MAKNRESEESTCHKSFLVLGSYILHFQDRTSAVNYVSTLGVTQCDPHLQNPGYTPVTCNDKIAAHKGKPVKCLIQLGYISASLSIASLIFVPPQKEEEEVERSAGSFPE